MDESSWRVKSRPPGESCEIASMTRKEGMRTVDGNMPWSAAVWLGDVSLDLVDTWFVASCETPDFVTALKGTLFLGGTQVLKG